MRMPRQATYRNDNLDSSVKIKSTLQWIWEDIAKYLNSNPFAQSNLVEAVVSGGAGVDFAVMHGLGRIPKGYVVVKIDKAAFIYTGITAWDVQNLYLQASDSAVTVSVLVF